MEPALVSRTFPRPSQATELHKVEPGAPAQRSDSAGTELSLTPMRGPGPKRAPGDDSGRVARGISLGSALTNRLQLPR